jgi:hypothetical protein
MQMDVASEHNICDANGMTSGFQLKKASFIFVNKVWKGTWMWLQVYVSLLLGVIALFV